MENEELTFEQVKQMNGQPVFAVRENETFLNAPAKFWCLISATANRVWLTNCHGDRILCSSGDDLEEMKIHLFRYPSDMYDHPVDGEDYLLDIYD